MAAAAPCAARTPALKAEVAPGQRPEPVLRDSVLLILAGVPVVLE